MAIPRERLFFFGTFWLTQAFLLILVIALWAAADKVYAGADSGYKFAEAWNGITLLGFLVASFYVIHYNPTDSTYMALLMGYVLTGSFSLSIAVWHGTYVDQAGSFAHESGRVVTGFASVYFTMCFVMTYLVNQARMTLGSAPSAPAPEPVAKPAAEPAFDMRGVDVGETNV